MVAFLLFASGAMRLIHSFVDHYQSEKDSSGRKIFPYVKRRRSRSFQILTYHRVNDEHDPFFPGIPTKVFARQMEYLASHRRVCSLTDLIDGLKQGSIPENAIAITFDDGYRDNFLHAFPVLKQLSIPATIFLATGVIGSPSVLWHDRVFSAFRETRVPFLTDFNNGSGSLSLLSLSDKLLAQRQVLEFLWSQTDIEREAWLRRLSENLEVADGGEKAGLMLSWDEVRTMHQQGVLFGSHTITHPILSRLSEERLVQELQDSKRAIEEKLGTEVSAFAYPVGRKQDFSEMTKSRLKEAGYGCALTTVFGANEMGQDLFELKRMMVRGSDRYTFGARLAYYKLSS